jgi:biopolymer transport protein ExbD
VRIESMELILPSAGGKAAKNSDMVHIFIATGGDMMLGKRPVDAQELTDTLQRMFKKDPDTKVMLLTAEGVSLQQLVGVMDQVYLIGGKSLFVRKWEN